MWRHPYRLVDVAVFPGPRHAGFSAKLATAGRAVARMVDEGNAGPLLWNFLAGPDQAAADEAALDAYADALPMEADETSSFDSWCRDAFAARLFADHRTMATLRALAPTRMVLLVPHIQKGMVPVVLPFPYDPSVRDMVFRRYGRGTIILNERLSAAASKPGPSRSPASGQGRETTDVLATSRDAPLRRAPARGPARHPAPVVRRDVPVRQPHVPDA